ncbi:MAG: adenylate kinase family protein [Phycisphaerae bacterium]
MAEPIAHASILMFGGPGCGKGTQGLILGQLPNLYHIAMGDVFRALDKDSEIGKEFMSYATKGLLVPDELTMRVFQHHVDGCQESGDIRAQYHTLLLDGIPRTIKQVELMESFMDVKRIVHLVMEDREALIARLIARAQKSNRPDDADRKVIENRLQVYDDETAPILQKFDEDLIVRINADQHPLAVLRDISNELIEVLPSKI